MSRRAAPRNLPPSWRAPLLALGFAGLIVGAGAGLARLGWSMPEAAVAASAFHGPLMMYGFFGVVISLERAVAIGRLWAYAGPMLAGLGGACWCAGNGLWLAGWTVHHVVPWWLSFLILTIAGERLELSRFLPPSPIAERVFVLLLAVVVAGLLAGWMAWGPRLFAAGVFGLSLWLVKQDIARRTVHGHGLTRFIAVCLLSGYGWLALGSAVILASGGLYAGTAAYDAALHAIALGFVFSMVFGHAPIIFPAVLRVTVPYHPSFYLPLALLHTSLVIRLVGDATGQFDWIRLGGMLNALALASFILGTVGAVVRGRRNARPA